MKFESSESPLGRWSVARWSPSPATLLYGLVECVWYFDGTMTHAKERVFPDGTAELIVMLDQPHRDGDDATLLPFPTVCINGLRTRPSVVVAPHGRCRVLGISFAPLGACAVLRTNMRDLVDVTIDLRAALGSACDELGERCAHAAQTSPWNDARNAAAVVDVAVKWIALQLADAADEPMMHWVSGAIRQARGVLSVEKLAAALPISRSLFARRFCDRTGLTPKRYARVVRFHHALTLLGRTGDIVSAATELGYYDQAHMYRDFEEFAKMTPGAFLSANRYPASASLAEA